MQEKVARLDPGLWILADWLFVIIDVHQLTMIHEARACNRLTL
jgi:hypothetical protein